MHLQHLKHFVAVAEELHFGRAAERIGMAQPPLSQSIRRLEDSLGCRLFLRTRRRVEITAAGEALLQHAREILNQLEYAQTAVRRANEAGVGRLTIGFTPNALSDALPGAMREIKRIAPDVEITLWEGATDDQITGLQTGRLDMGFLNSPTLEISGLEVRVVERPRVIAAIPEDWPLATKNTLQLTDLADQPLVMLPAHVRPDAHGAILAAFRAVGVTPFIAQEALYDTTRLRLAAAGMGIAVVIENAAPRGYPGLAMRPIADLSPLITTDLALAWRRTALPSLRKLFVAAYEVIKRV